LECMLVLKVEASFPWGTNYRYCDFNTIGALICLGYLFAISNG